MSKLCWIDPQNLLIAQDADRLVAHDPELRLGELIRRSLALAGGLRAQGARRAGLWFEDAAELACALLACWCADVQAVLPPDSLPATCTSLNEHVDLWLSDTFLPPAAKRRTDLHALQRHVPLDARVLDADKGGVLLLTSGSSGQPKHIVKTWTQLSEEVRSIEQQWPNQGDSTITVLGSVSVQHMYGLPFRLLWPLCSGRPIVRKQLAYPEDIQRASLAHAPCVWISSPALLRRFGEHLNRLALRDGVMQIFSSGGPLPPEAAEAFQQLLGLRPTEIYGSSETGAVAWRQGNSPWTPFSRVRVGVNADQALWVESPWLAQAREQTRDAVEFAGQGFQLLGRLDRIAKIEEKRIALPALERHLLQHPWVGDAHVDKRDDTTRLTALIALTPLGLHVLRNQGRRQVSLALQKHLMGQFMSVAIPRSWRLFGKLPRNAQDKLTRSVFENLSGPRPTSPIIRELPAQGDENLRCAIEVPLDLAYFSGHFPGVPVVPGVAQIGWAVDIARQKLFPDLQCRGMEVLKFQKLLRPGDTAELSLRWNAGNAKLYFAYTLKDEPCSSGRIIHQADHV
ncbi:AMP-binding protein [Azonexus sp.]|jgi:acyl-coenzyme A synthetase/AMP-(fatty) acid ligase/3-hydroxymyristoyl/3-hydroxydecanoyl-(acyl carrier protein) dehydratase|uniref:AMP-binding protein n=1 Tax=Azonexus sp. TaxID=1872668 RepID=UPI00281A91D8|nr:AMP-binding protein [Azonexus sp.]MDR1994335.1 AMP-binding protein [Azonexus sp.]